MLSAHAPACFEQGHPNVALMFPDYLEIEQSYVKETGIFPIMHAVAIRREIVEKYPWVAAQPVHRVRGGEAAAASSAR